MIRPYFCTTGGYSRDKYIQFDKRREWFQIRKHISLWGYENYTHHGWSWWFGNGYQILGTYGKGGVGTHMRHLIMPSLAKSSKIQHYSNNQVEQWDVNDADNMETLLKFLKDRIIVKLADNVCLYLPFFRQTPKPITVFCHLHWLYYRLANHDIKPRVTNSNEISGDSRFWRGFNFVRGPWKFRKYIF